MEKFKRLEDFLLAAKLLTEDDLARITEIQNKQVNLQKYKEGTGVIAVKEGILSEKHYIAAMHKWIGCPYVDISKMSIKEELKRAVPKAVAVQYGAIAIAIDGETVKVAMKNPADYEAIEKIRAVSKRKVIPCISTFVAIDNAILRFYGSESTDKAVSQMSEDESNIDIQDEEVSSIEVSEGNAPAINFVNSIIERAVMMRASDIHIEPRYGSMTVRVKIDGALTTIENVPREIQSAVIARIKVMGKMNVSEKRIPLDGRVGVVVNGNQVDLRISTLPTKYGESVVLRVLNKTEDAANKNAIGLLPEDMAKYEKILQNSYGVILIVGPTGSGKSTTATSMLKILNNETVNIITLEDPIEYEIPGANQTQINSKVGMTFATGLRAAMRQDPDIISVGEIRDGETADIAMRAAITGHLVISTVHTNDAVSTFHRLFDLGVEPYLIGSGIIAIISQRLVRKICPNCKEEYVPTDEELQGVNWDKEDLKKHKFYRGKGCPMCYGTGYHGRTGLFEILIMNKELREAVSRRATHEELARIAQKGDFVSLKENCLKLVYNGQTTLEEMKRTINVIE